jgi:hypothetical protein
LYIEVNREYAELVELARMTVIKSVYNERDAHGRILNGSKHKKISIDNRLYRSSPGTRTPRQPEAIPDMWM